MHGHHANSRCEACVFGCFLSESVEDSSHDEDTLVISAGPQVIAELSDRDFGMQVFTVVAPTLHRVAVDCRAHNLFDAIGAIGDYIVALPTTIQHFADVPC